MATRKITDIAVLIPDASPVMTLSRLGRLDLLGRFAVPIHIVDQVYWKVTRPQNDPDGMIAAGLHRLHNQFVVIETATAAGFRT
jgi:hypothetical protein